MDNTESVIHNFFKEYAGLDGLKDAALVICRRDGVPLYSYKEFQSDWNDSTVGALVGGIWQAAETLTQFIPDTDIEEEFRFSFETSSRGIFIVKLEGNFEPLYLSFIYFDLTNPGRMKARIRSIVSKLTFFIEENIVNEEPTTDGFLFDDISDSEMDDLFSGAMND